MLFDAKYSLINLLKIYRENKQEIEAYIKGKPIEYYDTNSHGWLGIGIGPYLLILFVSIVLWIIAIWFLVKNWDKIGMIAQILGIAVLFLPPTGPLVSLLVVFIARETGGWPPVSDS